MTEPDRRGRPRWRTADRGTRRRPGRTPPSSRSSSRRRARRGRGTRAPRRRSPALQCSPAQPRGRCVSSPPARRSARTSSGAPTRSSRRTRSRARPGAGTRASGAAAGPRRVPRSGSGCRSRSSTPRPTRATRVVAAAVLRAEAADVHLPGVERRPPSRIHSAMTRPTPPAPAMPCAQNPAATKKPCTSLSPSTNSLSGVNPSGPLTRLTMSACLGGRHPPARVLHQRREAIPVLGEQLVVEVVGHAVDRPRRRIALVAAEQQTVALAPEVHEVVGVAELRQVVGDTVDALGDQVLVRHRHDRHVDAGERRDLGRVHPARQHHRLGFDRAVVGDDVRDAPAVDDEVGDPHAGLDRDAAIRARRRGTRTSARSGRGSRRSGATRRRARPPGPSAGSARAPRRPTPAPSAARTSSPSRAGGAAPPSARRSTRSAASRPPASPANARSPRASASSRRYTSTLCIIIRVSGRLDRSWPTSPAEWNVLPLVGSARSSTSTSVQPALGEVPRDARARRRRRR